MSGNRQRILLLGYRPPPYFGPSVTYQALLRSSFAHQFAVTFINLSMVRDIRQLEHPGPGKVLRFCWQALQEVWHLTTKRVAFVCLPVSVNRNAFIKDALLARLAMLFRVPVVFYAHGNNLPDLHDRSSPRFQHFMASTIRRASGAIVLGECLRFNFERWLPPERIRVVPTGIEPAPELPAVAKPPGIATVLYLGNLIRDKGVFVLLEAAAAIKRSGRRDVRFVFAGAWYRPQDPADFRAVVEREGLQEMVTLAGSVSGEAKWRLLAGADLLAFPTFYYYETMGLVLLEAMQCGLPIVSTRFCSIPEIVPDGTHALLVEPRNPTQLADAILRLVDDPQLRAAMGEVNRQRGNSYYTQQEYGARMIAAFEALGRCPKRKGCAPPFDPDGRNDKMPMAIDRQVTNRRRTT